MSTDTATRPDTTVVTFARNDEVTINVPRCAGKVYVVLRANPVNCVVAEKGAPAGTPNIRVNKVLLVKVDPNATADPITDFGAAVQIPLMTYRVGEVVRLNGSFRRNTAGPNGTLMVVTKVNQTTLSLDPLGGPENGTPMRAPEGMVTKVDLADILR